MRVDAPIGSMFGRTTDSNPGIGGKETTLAGGTLATQ